MGTLQHWFANVLKRITKTPKLHNLDSGLLATARGLAFERVRGDRGAFSTLLESFVLSEGLKRMGASRLRLSPDHFCDRDKHEVDIVLEHDEGMLFRTEVKASAAVKAADFNGAAGFCRSPRRRLRIRRRSIRQHRCGAVRGQAGGGAPVEPLERGRSNKKSSKAASHGSV